MTEKEALGTAIEIMTEYKNDSWDETDFSATHTEAAIGKLLDMYYKIGDEDVSKD